MNSTNRALNRIFLIGIGIVLLACGLAAIAVTTLPDLAGFWRQNTPSIGTSVLQAWQVGVAFAGIPHVPWLLLAVPAGAVILIVLLLVFVFAQGRGHTSRLVDGMPLPATSTGERPGSLTVDLAVATDVVQHALADRPDTAAVSVAAYRVKGRPTLKLTVTPRRGVSPARVLAAVEAAAEEWDGLLGTRVPTFVHLNGGVRAALARSARTN